MIIEPLDEELLETLSADHRLIVVMNENNRSGGLGEAVGEAVLRRHLQTEVLNLEPADSFVPQGKPAELRRKLGIDAAGAADAILLQMKQGGKVRRLLERFGRKP